MSWFSHFENCSRLAFLGNSEAVPRNFSEWDIVSTMALVRVMSSRVREQLRLIA